MMYVRLKISSFIPHQILLPVLIWLYMVQIQWEQQRFFQIIIKRSPVCQEAQALLIMQQKIFLLKQILLVGSVRRILPKYLLMEYTREQIFTSWAIPTSNLNSVYRKI